MSNTSFDFQEKKYHIYAFVEQTCVASDDPRLYTTVALRFEGSKGREVFSGTAIAVPQDWSMKFDSKASQLKVIKTGVQLALNRAITGALNDTTQYKGDWGKFQSFVHRMDTAYETRRKDIAEAFWKAFLPHIEEL